MGISGFGGLVPVWPELGWPRAQNCGNPFFDTAGPAFAAAYGRHRGGLDAEFPADLSQGTACQAQAHLDAFVPLDLAAQGVTLSSILGRTIVHFWALPLPLSIRASSGSALRRCALSWA